MLYFVPCIYVYVVCMVEVESLSCDDFFFHYRREMFANGNSPKNLAIWKSIYNYFTDGLDGKFINREIKLFPITYILGLSPLIILKTNFKRSLGSVHNRISLS